MHRYITFTAYNIDINIINSSIQGRDATMHLYLYDAYSVEPLFYKKKRGAFAPPSKLNIIQYFFDKFEVRFWF